MITMAGPGENWQGKVWRCPRQQVIGGKQLHRKIFLGGWGDDSDDVRQEMWLDENHFQHFTTAILVMTMIIGCRQHVVTAGHCIKNKQLNNLNVTLGEVYYTMIIN